MPYAHGSRLLRGFVPRGPHSRPRPAGSAPCAGRNARGRGAKHRRRIVDGMSASKTVDTHCPYCALQCGMGLRPGSGGIPEVVERDFPVNRGALCGKGRTAPAVLSPTARLTGPLVRDRASGRLEPATWEDALDRVAEGLLRVRAAHGPDAVGVFGGGG